MTVGRSLAWAVIATLATAQPCLAEGLPGHVGQCVITKIAAVETRLEDGFTHAPIKGSGSAVRFVNGGYQVSYDTVPAIEHSRAGDRVRLCLHSIPRSCPP